MTVEFFKEKYFTTEPIILIGCLTLTKLNSTQRLETSNGRPILMIHPAVHVIYGPHAFHQSYKYSPTLSPQIIQQHTQFAFLLLHS